MVLLVIVTAIVRGDSSQHSLLHFAANQGNRSKRKVLNVQIIIIGKSILAALMLLEM